MPRGKRIVLVAATLSLGLASLAVAQQEGAKGVVAIRQATMDANAKHMNAIKAILTEDPQLLPHVAFHAQAIAEAAEYVPEMFPRGHQPPRPRCRRSGRSRTSSSKPRSGGTGWRRSSRDLARRRRPGDAGGVRRARQGGLRRLPPDLPQEGGFSEQGSSRG